MKQKYITKVKDDQGRVLIREGDDIEWISRMGNHYKGIVVEVTKCDILVHTLEGQLRTIDLNPKGKS